MSTSEPFTVEVPELSDQTIEQLAELLLTLIDTDIFQTGQPVKGGAE